MVGNGKTGLKIIKEAPGVQTGDFFYQTEDGRWWEPWNRIAKTGEEVRQKTNGELS